MEISLPLSWEEFRLSMGGGCRESGVVEKWWCGRLSESFPKKLGYPDWGRAMLGPGLEGCKRVSTSGKVTDQAFKTKTLLRTSGKKRIKPEVVALVSSVKLMK